MKNLIQNIQKTPETSTDNDNRNIWEEEQQISHTSTPMGNCIYSMSTWDFFLEVS